MSYISPAARRRLAACLELLSSDKEGERQAAAAAATRIVRQAGLRWGDILLPEPELEPKPYAAQAYGWSSPGGEHRYARWPTWRDTVAACQQHRYLFTQWERDFLDKLEGFPRLSSKQANILRRLAGQCREGGR